MKLNHILLAFLLATASSAQNAAAQAPPAPTLIEPASGAALAQPMTIRMEAGRVGQIRSDKAKPATITMTLAIVERRDGQDEQKAITVTN